MRCATCAGSVAQPGGSFADAFFLSVQTIASVGQRGDERRRDRADDGTPRSADDQRGNAILDALVRRILNARSASGGKPFIGRSTFS
jgi:hypothetical protein